MKFGKYKHKNSTNKDDQTRLMVKLLDKYFTENYDNKRFKKCAIQIGFKKKDFYKTLNKGLEIIINTKNPEDIGLYILIKVDKTKKRGEYKQFGIALEWGCKIIEKEDRNEIDTMDYTGIVTTILNSKEVKDIQLNNRQLFIENINQFQQNLNKSINIYNKGFAPFEFNNIHLEEFFKWVDTGKEYANYEIIEIE